MFAMMIIYCSRIMLNCLFTTFLSALLNSLQ